MKKWRPKWHLNYLIFLTHDALAEFGMSAETLEYYHDLHHNAYVVNGNNPLAPNGQINRRYNCRHL